MNDPTTGEEKRATRAHALVAFLIICCTLAALLVLAALHIAGVAAPNSATYLAIFFGGTTSVFVTALIAARKPKGRATNITDHRPAGQTSIFNSKENN